MLISGFTFVHNAIESGYPIIESVNAVKPYVDEILVINCDSTDGTLELLEQLNVRIINTEWGDQAGETLKRIHSKYIECLGDIIIHFEADEVYSNRLIRKIVECINDGYTDLAVYRLQLEQNFQRCRWYPEPVHRVFSRFSHTRKAGHTTDRHDIASIISPDYGFLWDITNCFRDNWLKRVENQAELWHGKEPSSLMVPLHATHQPIYNKKQIEYYLQANHWTWKTTPFNIPEILKPLVGMTKYESNSS